MWRNLAEEINNLLRVKPKPRDAALSDLMAFTGMSGHTAGSTV